MPPKKTAEFYKKQKEREKARNKSNFGPGEGEEFNEEPDALRQREISEFAAVCAANGYRVVSVAADGDCLFRAVADQLALLGLGGEGRDHRALRAVAAAEMRRRATEYLPYALADGGDTLMDGAQFAAYCDVIEDTSEWGGDKELMALGRALDVRIGVLRSSGALQYFGERSGEGGSVHPPPPTAVLSYHEHLFLAGGHYNSLHRK